MSMTIIFNIKRFDGTNTWNQEYRFPYEVNTLLGCLTKIREEQDDTLNFTSACRHAICGSCAVQVNGNAYLACETQLDTLIDTFKTTQFYLEPLNNFPVVRDLVVRFEEKAEKMKKVQPWMCPHKDRTDHKQSDEDYRKYIQATDCILCGICASECRELAYDDGTYLEPFIMNKAYRFARDSRDGDHAAHVLGALENNLWKCMHCQQCSTKCPKGIPIASEISYLRREAMRMGNTKSKGARHAYAFYNDLKNTGTLNEVMLALRTEGMLGTAKARIPFAVRMVLAGKMNPLHQPKKVAGIEGVRKLVEIARTVKED